MVDVAVVTRRLNALNDYVDHLETRRDLTFEQMIADWETYYAIQRLFQLAAQATVDIASHVLSSDFSVQFDDYHGAIVALGKEGVLPADFAQRFADVARFRNVLVHEYLVIDPAKVYAYLQTGLTDFRDFSRYIIEHLEKTGAL